MLNNSIAIREAVLAGMGISLMPSFYVAAEVDKRRLRVLLAGAEPPPLHVSAVYQRSRHLSPKVRALAELLRERFARASWAV